MSKAVVLNFGEETARHFRNQRWAGHHLIPSWVDLATVGLDQFFTRPETQPDRQPSGVNVDPGECLSWTSAKEGLICVGWQAPFYS